MPRFFLHDNHAELFFFGGKGGVGKTTCAAAAAIFLAHCHPDESCLLVSIDPAHSLKDSLADFSPPSNLHILEFEAYESLVSFKKKHSAKLREIAARGTFLDEEDINRLLKLSLPGLDEVMAFLEISSWVTSKQYARVVVDTAPTGHTLRLLGMPSLIRKWLLALDALLSKHRYMKQLFQGSYRQDEMDTFLLELTEAVQNMEMLLRDHRRCCFVPVMIAEKLSLEETSKLLRELRRANIAVKNIIVNSLFPSVNCPFCTEKRRLQEKELKKWGQAGYRLWAVPLYPAEVRGGALLSRFWEGAFVLDLSSPETSSPTSGREIEDFVPMVEFPGKLVSEGTRMLLFGGKGGVGKTTLACATALAAAESRKVFLFSTDPAHSLSDCFDLAVGSNPTRVAPDLMVMEIDAQAEFDLLKKEYAEELEQFLENISTNLDFTFDRKVMERVLDLSPPGVDEVMALAKALDFLNESNHHLLIFDTAPTGHLLRLLETPEIIDQWLKVFFGLFLKYKKIFRLPRVAQRLVRLSRELKELRVLLRSRDQSALYCVTIMTEMAYAETEDLIRACEERLGIHVAGLFLNLATPPSACDFCTALHLRETEIRVRYKNNFPGQHQTLVFRVDTPRGIERLTALGQALYLPS